MALTNYIYYSFDAFKDIAKGMSVLDEKGLKKPVTLSELERTGKHWEDTNFFGKNLESGESTEKQFSLEDGLSRFLSPRILKEIEDSYDTVMSEIDLGGNILPSRIKFSSKPMGVFDFSQASKGLIRPVEFYSTSENKVIKKDLVQKESKSGKTLFFYNNKEKIYLQKRQEGTTDIVQNCTDVEVKFNEELDMYLPYRGSEIVNECDGYRLRYTSTNPKVYAYREKLGGGSTPFVDLYIPMGGVASKNPESMAIRAIPNLLLSRTLERAGVKVRIFGLWSTADTKDVFTISLMLKNYGETISTNQLAIFCADTRFYRYWLANSAKGLIKDKFGVSKPVFEGTGTLTAKKINDYIMPRLRNYTLYNIEKGNFSSQLVDKNLILFVPLDADSDEKIDSPEVREKIKETYTQYIDYISIKFSVNPSRIIKDIQNRMTEKGKSNSEIVKYLRDAVTNVYKSTRSYGYGSSLLLTTETKIKEAPTLLAKENQYILDTEEQYNDTEKGRQRLFNIINKTIK